MALGLSFGATLLPIGEPLSGVNEISFSEELSFFDGTWQEEASRQFESQIPARPYIVRAQHQLKFELGGNINQHIYARPNEVLFEKVYLDLIADKTPFSDEELLHLSTVLERFQDSLERAGKQFLFISIPGKPNFFQGSLPQGWEIASTNNRIRLLDALREKDIELLDMYPVLRDFESRTGFDAFTRYGTHWSQGASKFSYVAAIEKINEIKEDTLINAKVNRVRSSSAYHEVEVDLWETLNLLQDSVVPSGEVSVVNIQNRPSGQPSSLCLIGDSFYWQWFGQGVTGNHVFNPSWFLYYHSNAHKFGEGMVGTVDLALTREAIASSEMVVIMLVDANLKMLPFHIEDYLNGTEW